MNKPKIFTVFYTPLKLNRVFFINFIKIKFTDENVKYIINGKSKTRL